MADNIVGDKNGNDTPDMNQNAKEFHDLARKIALNLIHVSIDSKEVENAIKETMNSKVGKCEYKDAEYRPERFVVVVGAGASHDAFNGIPLGKSGAELLKKELTKGNQDIIDMIDDELVRLETVYKLNPGEFETQLLAYNKFYSNTQGKGKNLVDTICELYHHMYYPSLCYEMLAHMFKHRFIDVIINFNFDEILDRAIEDELCQADYYKVISDGNCPNDINKLMIDNKFKKPLYIKPHGTASHKSTLRFTREDYFKLPRDIETLLKTVLSGKTCYNDAYENIPINLIVIGFHMQSIEFNKILVDNLPNFSAIYYINPKGPDYPINLPAKFKKSCVFISGKDNRMLSKEPINDNNRSYLDALMLKLWKSISLNFNKNYKSRFVDRHCLISDLFADKQKNIKNPNKIEKYLKDRTYMELVLSISKSKGFINMHQLTNGRVGIYYNLYIEQFSKNLTLKKTNLVDKKPEALFEFCKKLGLKEIGYAREAFKLEKEDILRPDNLIVAQDKFETIYITKLFKALTTKNILSKPIRSQLKCLHDDFKTTLELNYKGTEVEICPQYKDIYNNIFSSPKVLNTMLALKYYTNKLFKGDWDAMLHVGETGEWLLYEKSSNWDNKKIAIIVADPAYRNELIKQFKKNLYKIYKIEPKFLDKFCETHHCHLEKPKLEMIAKPSKEEVIEAINGAISGKIGIDDVEFADPHVIYYLPWWMHNQHMSIFLQSQGQGSPMKVFKSIYFTRRLRSANINPILLEVETDNNSILESFAAYLLQTKEAPNTIINRKQTSAMITQLKESVNIEKKRG